MKLLALVSPGQILREGDLFIDNRTFSLAKTHRANYRARKYYFRPMKKSEIKNYFSKLGKKKSPAKAAAAKANGAKGGRKPKTPSDIVFTTPLKP